MTNKFLTTKKAKAFALIDVILGASLFLIVAVFVVPGFLYGQESAQIDGKRLRALSYAEGGLEAMRSIRDEDFNQLNPGTFGITIDNNFWKLTGSSDTDGEFTRRVQLIEENENKYIARSTVTWAQNSQRNGELTLETILTNFAREEEIDDEHEFNYSIEIFDDWIGGYCANVTITTESEEEQDWDIDIILNQAPYQGIVYTAWNANWSFSEPTFSVSNLPSNEWNTSSASSPATFGYCADRTLLNLPISVVASYSSPSDGGSQNGPIATISIPNEDLVIGDLIVIFAAYQGGATIEMDNTAGQEWNSFNNNSFGNHISSRIFFAIYNGNLNGNPSVTAGAWNSSTFSAVAHVFRNTDPYWAIDTWESSNTYNSPRNPGDVEISGINTNVNDTMVLAFWATRSNTPWQLQSSDWDNIGSSQYRNNSGNSLSLSSAYKSLDFPSFSANVTNRQTGTRQRGSWHIFSIR